MINNQAKTMATFSIGFLLALLWGQGLGSAVLGLLIAGQIPGTAYSIPFWAMMAIYCLLITALLTWYIEKLIQIKRANDETKKARLPRRRFSQI